MYIRRKVFSVLTDEMGEERLYSVNETVLEGFEYDEVEQKEFANTRHLKKALTTALEKGSKGKYTIKDAIRASKLKGAHSLKALENPHYDKLIKASMNKSSKLTGIDTKSALKDLGISKSELIDSTRKQAKKLMPANKPNLKKGELKEAVNTINSVKDYL